MRVEYAREDWLGRMTLCNPPHNLLAHPVFADKAELAAFLADPLLKAVIVRGEGRHFSAGADFLTARGRDAGFSDSMRQGAELLEMLRFATVPVAALVRGKCLGAGFEIALACHFRFAADDALFGFPEAGHGMPPGFGRLAFGPETRPAAKLIELALSAAVVPAGEARSLGLVDRVLPDGDLEAECLAFLRSLTAGRPPRLVRMVMESIHNSYRLPAGLALARETELFCEAAGAAAEREAAAP